MLLKKLSIYCFTLIILLFGSQACFSEGQTPNVAQPLPQNVEKTTDVNKDLSNGQMVSDSIPERNFENIKKITESAPKSSFMTFLTFICSIIGLGIAFGLYKWHKYRKEKIYIVEAPLKDTLATPKDFKTVINLFLGKTDE